MAGGCCCMRPRNAIYITSSILIVGWTIQLIMSVERFVTAILWSHDNPDHRDEEGGTRVGVSGLMVIVDSSQAALSALLLSATFFRDLNKLQPWLILVMVVLIAYVPVTVAACLVQVTSQIEFIISWIFVMLTMYSIWLVIQMKKELANVSLERLL